MWLPCRKASARPHDRCGPRSRWLPPRHAGALSLAARVGLLLFLISAAIVVIPGAAMTAHASAGAPGTAIETLPLSGGSDACLTNNLPANDDGSTAAVPLGFTLNFFGTQYTNVYVNNNGNITFTGPLGTYTPFGIASAGTKIIAPFFADVYTIGNTPLTYSSPGAIYQGRPAFCVDWVNVGYYASSSKLNSFQAILVDRSDIGTGDFDIIYNYNQIHWETGSASGGTNGLGGNPAHAGYSNGSNISYEFPGSGTVGAFLDTNANGLIYGSYGSTQPGRYIFGVRNGVVPTPTYPIASFSSSTVAFGSLAIGATASRTLTVTNNGAAPLHVTGLGGLSGDFSDTTTCLSAAIAPAATCSIQVTFSPTSSGTQTETLSLTDDASNSPQAVTVSGTGSTAGATLSQPSLSFGNVEVGASAVQTLTITNSGGVPLHVTGINGLSGDFSQSNTCLVQPVPAGGSCTIAVTLAPTAMGSESQTLTITDDAPGSPQTVALSGTATQAIVSLTNGSIAFGDQVVASSTTHTLTITNVGTATLNVSGISGLSGALSQTNTCVGQAIAVGATCTITVTFAPTASGLVAQNLTITDDAVDSPQTFGLSGNGTQPSVSFNTTSLAFGSQRVGTTASQTITVTNSGSADLHVSGITGPSGVFGESDTCVGVAIAPAATCTITVSFRPTANGAVPSQTLHLAYDGGATQAVTLSGTGVSSSMSGIPNSLSFGSVAVGSSATQTVTITNNGSAALNITALSGLSGDLSASDTCVGTAIQPYQSCVITVTYTPSAVGSVSQTVHLTDDALSGLQSFTVTGTGLASGVSGLPDSVGFGPVAVGASQAQTITITNNGNAPLHVTGIGGLSGALSESDTCLGVAVAAGQSCAIVVTFAPTVTGSVTQTLQLTDDAPGLSQSVTLTGTGAVPVATFSSSSIDFGPALVGTSGTQTLTVTNSGLVALHITSVSGLTGDFSESDTCAGLAVAAGASCVVTVTFAPTASGLQSENLTLADDASGGAQTIAFLGTGTAPVLNLSNATVDFGGVALGTSQTYSFTLTNSGTADLHIASISGLSGSFTMTTTCPMGGAAVAPGVSCTVTIAFTSTTLGAQTQTLTLVTDASLTPVTVQVSATGTEPTASVSSTISFGSQLVGTSAKQTITLKNTGTADLIIRGVTSAQNDFSTSTTCVGHTLAPGATCTLSVTFTPMSAVAETQQLVVTDNATPGSLTITLSGAGVAPALGVSLGPVVSGGSSGGNASMSGSALDFGAQAVGVETDQSIVITNTGTADLWVNGVTIDGASPQAAASFSQSARTLAWLPASRDASAAGSSFRVTSDTCTSQTVAPGASCAVAVGFDPSASGEQTANLLITSNASRAATMLLLKGVGQAAQATATATPVPTTGATGSSTSHTGSGDSGLAAFLGGSSGLLTPITGGACTGVLLVILVAFLLARRRRRDSEEPTMRQS